MTHVIAIDPGPERSALVVWNGESIVVMRHEPNEDILWRLYNWRHSDAGGELPIPPNPPCPCVIEKVASFGMPVGEEVFETVFWSGRFSEAYGAERVHRVTRMQVKMHLCHSSRAKDANISQALKDRFGKPGTKKTPGVLYGVKHDLWAALALAVTWWDQQEGNSGVAA
jgi:hypothetical protein